MPSKTNRGDVERFSAGVSRVDELKSIDTPLLLCVGCGHRFTIVEATTFRFHVASMTCSSCLEKAKAQEGLCLGEWDNTSKACQKFCIDRRECRRFESLPMKRELTIAARQAALDLLQVKRRAPRPKYTHPFPMAHSLIRACWDMCLRGTTIWELEKVCVSSSGSLAEVLRAFRKGERWQFRWNWIEDGNGQIRIDWKG